jgi:cellulose synthase/poly-beta-1,6-N-acetylglucosamine synthase-like glycosyltransferase
MVFQMNFKFAFNKKRISNKLFLLVIFLFIAIFIYFAFKLNLFLFIVLSAIFLYMTIIFIFTYFLYPNIAKTKELPKVIPDVVAVTYAFNNWVAVKYTVEKLKKLKYPKKVPIYVITDGTCGFLDSDKDVTQIILPEKYFTRDQINVKATIMNLGLKKIKTDYLFCVDGDTLPNNDALINMVGFMIKNVAVVNGVLLPSNNKNFLEKLQTIEYNFSWGISLRVLSALNSISVAVGGMCLIKKSAFDKVGGYDETNVTEDRELAYRLMKEGYVIRCAESSRGYTEVPNTIKSFFNQRLRWYSGEIATICKHKNFLFNQKLDVFGLIVLPYTFIMQIVGVG